MHLNLMLLILPFLSDIYLSWYRKRWQPNDLIRSLLAPLFIVLFDLFPHAESSASLWTSEIIVIVGGFFAMAAIGESRLRSVLCCVFWAWTSFFSVSAWLGLTHSGNLFVLSYVSMTCLFIVGTHLVDNIEVQSGKALNASQVSGIAADYPVESGLILTVLLLLGCAPGSLLFVIEDIAIGQIFDGSIVTAIGMAVIVVISSIACYRSFVRIFHGRGLASNPGILRKEHFFAERLILAITIIVGVLPKIIG